METSFGGVTVAKVLIIIIEFPSSIAVLKNRYLDRDRETELKLCQQSLKHNKHATDSSWSKTFLSHYGNFSVLTR